MEKDEEETDALYGQRLQDTFPLADLFINIDDVKSASVTLNRFVSSLFSSNEISPTPDEYGMYMAKSAALRSLVHRFLESTHIIWPRQFSTSMCERRGGG